MFLCTILMFTENRMENMELNFRIIFFLFGCYNDTLFTTQNENHFQLNVVHIVPLQLVYFDASDFDSFLIAAHTYSWLLTTFSIWKLVRGIS